MIARKVRDALYARAGFRCERCGVHVNDAATVAFSAHHRRPRGMGGSRRPDTDTLPNLLLLCGDGIDGCHGWVESHRTEAIAAGLLLSQQSDPATVPARLLDGLVLLSSDGTRVPTTYVQESAS